MSIALNVQAGQCAASTVFAPVSINRRRSRIEGECLVQLGVIGLGQMVASMVRRLLKSGHERIFIDFAVSRSSFWDAVSAYHARTLTRAEAAAQIAGRLHQWVDVFEAGRPPHPAGTA